MIIKKDCPQDKNRVDKLKLLDHLTLCSELSKDETVKQVLINLKHELVDGAFDDIPTED